MTRESFLKGIKALFLYNTSALWGARSVNSFNSFKTIIWLNCVWLTKSGQWYIRTETSLLICTVFMRVYLSTRDFYYTPHFKTDFFK